MKKIINKAIFLGCLSALLCSCGFFDKDNTPPPAPLTDFTPEARIHTVWMTHVNAGMGKEYLKLIPAMNNQFIFTADKKGTVTATDAMTGKKRWQHSAGVSFSGGPAVSGTVLAVGSKAGDVFAFDPTDGHLLWHNKTPSAIFSAPAVKEGFVVAKSIDGTVTAFSATDGHILWHYKQTEPSLILRGSSAPEISRDAVIVGFANGVLAKLTLSGGNLLWQNTIAEPEGSFVIQRMVDIDADPKIDFNTIYTVTYQGRIAALDFNNGQSLWTQDLSSYTGLTFDDTQIYVSDVKSYIWAFNKKTGTVNWRFNVLEARNITAPVIMGPYLVVADAEGYLHWLSKEDGHIVARVKVDRSGILAAPIVRDTTLYVLTKNGYLVAYRYSA